MNLKMEEEKQPLKKEEEKEKKKVAEQQEAKATETALPPLTTDGEGGWGGWGFSPFSYLSDLQKAAAVAAEEISRNVRLKCFFVCALIMHSVSVFLISDLSLRL